jgi:CelD/BcsL family acetyltransferase involved in cellulose biosynthesis
MIAFNYDLEYAGRMVGLLTACDEALPRRCSPGNVLLLRTLQAAERRGVTAYELGSVGGRKSGKLQWASQNDSTGIHSWFRTRRSRQGCWFNVANP